MFHSQLAKVLWVSGPAFNLNLNFNIFDKIRFFLSFADRESVKFNITCQNFQWELQSWLDNFDHPTHPFRALFRYSSRVHLFGLPTVRTVRRSCAMALADAGSGLQMGEEKASRCCPKGSVRQNKMSRSFLGWRESERPPAGTFRFRQER